jgi:cell division protein FtsI/penicillin-binding protein 2
MAWGQGELVATPAAVARLAAGIANKGLMVPNRFVLQLADSVVGTAKGTAIARDPQYASLLSGYMKAQSAGRAGALGMIVAGKTGTPERIVRQKRVNDGWYVFFAPKPEGNSHVVVCVRIEDCKGSSEAVTLSGRHVIPLLRSMGYLKSFETKKSAPDKGNF